MTNENSGDNLIPDTSSNTSPDTSSQLTQEENLNILKQKIQSFYELNHPVHIKFKDGIFKNGYIEKIASDFFILNEFKRNKEFIFFVEIDRVDAYREIEEKKE